MNDPTHVHALSNSDWLAVFREIRLQPSVIGRYKLEFPLVRMLEAASMLPQRIAQIDGEVRASIAAGKLAGHARLKGDNVQFIYPIAVFAAVKGEHV